jgi:hypothetical protein
MQATLPRGNVRFVRTPKTRTQSVTAQSIWRRHVPDTVIEEGRGPAGKP